MDPSESIASAKEVIRIEADAVRSLLERIDERFAAAVDLILASDGRVVVTGMGKAGIIGRKIQATLASTGTPSLWLHPAEAIHGDLGMILAGDIVLALSNSGETEELLKLFPFVKKLGARILSIAASSDSSLGRLSDVVLEIGKIEEACPLKLAPSASTAAMLALGDALALTLQKARQFTDEDYVARHPGGSLAHKVNRVRDFMRTGERCPVAGPEERLAEIPARLTRARAGCVSVVDGEQNLIGVVTDGDFRRVLANGTIAEDLERPVREFMTTGPKFIGPDAAIAEAMGIFRDRKINALPVVGDNGKLVGLLDVQDIVGLRIEP